MDPPEVLSIVSLNLSQYLPSCSQYLPSSRLPYTKMEDQDCNTNVFSVYCMVVSAIMKMGSLQDRQHFLKDVSHHRLTAMNNLEDPFPL